MSNRLIEFEKLVDIVSISAKNMKEYFYADKELTFKGETDIVTQYDVALEKELTVAFNKEFPDFKVIGEESALIQDAVLQGGKVIYLDPIDGTTNFVHSFPFTCISVGVFVDSKPYAAVVHAPILGEVYTAIKGEGAYLNGKRLKVSSVDKPIRALFSTGFPYDAKRREEVTPIFNHLVKRSQAARRTGSAALDLCYVARGTFDMYYESELKPWDIAAGILIVEEAGGRTSDLSNNPHDLSEQFILATNSILHDEYIKLINEVI